MSPLLISHEHIVVSILIFFNASFKSINNISTIYSCVFNFFGLAVLLCILIVKRNTNVIGQSSHTKNTNVAPCVSTNNNNNKEKVKITDLHFPFHTSTFEDVSVPMRVLFVTWTITFGFILFIYRSFSTIVVSVILRKPKLLAERFFFRGILNWNVTSTVVRDVESSQKMEDRRPTAFFFNHHCTFDPWMIKLAIQDMFNLDGKIMVKNTVYNNYFLRTVLGEKTIDALLITSHGSIHRFIDIFHEWVHTSNASISSAQECIMLAPSGMTTHTKFQNQMYWEYLAEKNVKKIMVHVDVVNPFGLNLRSISTSVTTSLLICAVMPWLSINVTFYPDILLDDERQDKVTCQADADLIVQKIYTVRHQMTFSTDWKISRRRKVDDYLSKGLYNQFIPKIQNKSNSNGTFQRKNPLIVAMDANLPHTLRNTIPNEIKLVTTSLIKNKVIVEEMKLNSFEILLVNPSSKVDEMIAAAYDIPMWL